MVNKTNKSSENENSSDSDRKMTSPKFLRPVTSSQYSSQVLSITSRQFNTHVVTFRRLSYNCFDNNEY